MTSWDEMTRGVGCPFCGQRASADEYKIEIAKLDVSTLYLKRDQAYPGLCMLVFDRRHVTGLEELTPDEHPPLMADLYRAARAISIGTSSPGSRPSGNGADPTGPPNPAIRHMYAAI